MIPAFSWLTSPCEARPIFWQMALAGLTLIHSNSQVEGQVTRIKLIKRMMFGRAGFVLLRQRVLHVL
jgi:transposase